MIDLFKWDFFKRMSSGVIARRLYCVCHMAHLEYLVGFKTKYVLKIGVICANFSLNILKLSGKFVYSFLFTFYLTVKNIVYSVWTHLIRCIYPLESNVFKLHKLLLSYDILD